jgi:hypothetical protein
MSYITCTGLKLVVSEVHIFMMKIYYSFYYADALGHSFLIICSDAQSTVVLSSVLVIL